MTGLLLATLLNLSPGIQLADNVAARNVALSEARLPLLFVSDDEETKKPSIDAMTRDQLAAELRRLDETKPSIVGPIVMLAIGAPLVIGGSLIVIEGLGNIAAVSGTTFSATFGAYFVGYFLIIAGAAFITVGAILAIIGGIKLAMRLGSKRAHTEETDEIRKRIDTMDQAAPPPQPPPPPELMPPPPPPPPQANFVVPGQMMTMMTF